MHQTLLDPAGGRGTAGNYHCWCKEVTVACSTNLLPSLPVDCLAMSRLAGLPDRNNENPRVHSSAAPLKNWESDGTGF